MATATSKTEGAKVVPQADWLAVWRVIRRPKLFEQCRERRLQGGVNLYFLSEVQHQTVYSCGGRNHRSSLPQVLITLCLKACF